jgi:hypothetical protein
VYDDAWARGERVGTPVLVPCRTDRDCGDCGGAGKCSDHFGNNPGFFPGPSVEGHSYFDGELYEWPAFKETAVESVCRMGAYMDGLAAEDDVKLPDDKVSWHQV